MENVKKLLDEAKEKTGSATDYALAKTLDLARPRIHEYYKGKSAPDEFACLKIAEATGRTFEEVTALVKLEAEKNEKRREVWRKRLVSLGGIAATVTALIFAPVILKMTPEAGNASATTVSSGQTLYYVNIWQQITETAEAVRRELNMLFRRVFYADSPNAYITA